MGYEVTKYLQLFYRDSYTTQHTESMETKSWVCGCQGNFTAFIGFSPGVGQGLVHAIPIGIKVLFIY